MLSIAKKITGTSVFQATGQKNNISAKPFNPGKRLDQQFCKKILQIKSYYISVLPRRVGFFIFTVRTKFLCQRAKKV